MSRFRKTFLLVVACVVLTGVVAVVTDHMAGDDAPLERVRINNEVIASNVGTGAARLEVSSVRTRAVRTTLAAIGGPFLIVFVSIVAADLVIFRAGRRQESRAGAHAGRIPVNRHHARL